MDNAVIAIKTADGSRFPILDRNDRGRKRVVLTTSRDNQERVQIDMYQGDRDDLANAEYVGSLVIDDIDAASAGSVEISLILGIDDRGQLQARAQNLSNGDTQSLSISLDQTDETGSEASVESSSEELPDFSLDDEESFDLSAELEEPPVFDPDESSPESADDTEFGGPDLDDLAFELPEEDDSEFDQASGDVGESEQPFSGEFDAEGEDDELSPLEAESEYDELESLEGASEDEEPASLEAASDYEAPASLEAAGDELTPVEDEEAAPARAETEDFSFDEFDSPYADQRLASHAATEPGIEDEEGETADEADAPVAPAGPSSIYFVAYMLLGLAILAGLVYLIYGAFQAEPVPPLESAVDLGLAWWPLPFIGGQRAVRQFLTPLRKLARIIRGECATG